MPAGSISQANSFVGPITQVIAPTFACSISGTWTGTLTLQRMLDDVNWHDVHTFTSNVEFEWPSKGDHTQWRIGFKSDGLPSGTAVIWLDYAFQSASDFPLSDPDLMWDLRPFSNQHYSALLGLITADEAFVQASTTSSLVLDGNDRLVTIAAGDAPVAEGRGLWLRSAASNRIDGSNDLNHASWTKTNMNVFQDYPSPFVEGTPLGWRCVPTAANATIVQTTTAFTPGAITTTLANAMLYWNGTPLHGAIEITQYGFSTALDIRPYLVAGKWEHIAGLVEEITGASNVSGIRIVDVRDEIGFCLLNVERAATASLPIVTPGTAQVNVDADDVTQNMANFPSLHDVPKFTVLVVVVPYRVPVPADADMGGWTAIEINNAYDITATGTGGLVANGVGDGHSTMTVTAPPSFGAFVAGDRMVVGTGVGSYMDIVEQLTGTPGGAGTYDMVAPLSLYPDGQTTATPIVLQARLPNAQGYGGNATTKDALTVPPYRRNVGVTFSNEPSINGYGVDPQVEQWEANEPNAMGWSIDTTDPEAIVALKGDTSTSDPSRLTVAPALNSSVVVSYGCAYPNVGPFLGGTLLCSVGIARYLTPAERIATLSNLLQSLYEA